MLTAEELARLVRAMRALQREYFDGSRRRPDTLRRSMDAERAVDRAVEEVLGPDTQGRLF